MSTTVIVASSTAAISASIAAQQARKHEGQCKLYIEGFDNLKSSTAEKQHYAECIQTLYPKQISEESSMVYKGCVIALLIAMVVGMIYGWKEGCYMGDRFSSTIFHGLLFPAVLILGVMILGLVVSGIIFVLS